jgi:hypothetical protein
MWRKAMDSNNNDNEKNHDTGRREFLRKSVYAAYATPLITALLVEDANARPSSPGPDCAKCVPKGCKSTACQRKCGC